MIHQLIKMLGFSNALRIKACSLCQQVRFLTAIAATFLLMSSSAVYAETAPQHEAQSILHMLDYLSVDYGGSVLFGKVLNEREYREQSEFAAQSVKLLSNLPANPDQAALIMEAQELDRKVQMKAPAEQVSSSAQQLRKEIISAYQIPVSPRKIPNATQALALYQQQCVKCHGTEGFGDGSQSNTLNPKPANFHDATRMGQRSVYGLYNAISLGVASTGMTGYAQLSDDERWGLAFLVSNFHNLPERQDLGEKLWKKREFKGAVPNLEALATLTSNEVSIKYGDNTRAVFEYLRAQPQALKTTRHATLIFATEQLDHALTSYSTGDRDLARSFAIAAYLEGFEPMEISLTNLNAQLRFDIEQEMMAIRQYIYNRAPVDALSMKIKHAKELLRQADELLREGKLTITGAFASSFLILLREGFLVILILPTILAFVLRSERRSNALTYIHAGWGSALMLSIFTWVATMWLLDISGYTRAITSGLAALAASTLLAYVWFWLQGKTHTPAWRQFMKDQVGAALEKKVLKMLALISFFIVYSELFETILFYQALWAQTSDFLRTALWSGVIAASLILLATAWGLFHICIKLPAKAFFSGASILFATMTVIFTGQGLALLQEAGIVATQSFNFITLPLLGVFPTAQTLIAQLAIIVIFLLGYRVLTMRRRHSENDIHSATEA